MSVTLPLQINHVQAIPLVGYEPIGTLTNLERYNGHQLPGFKVKYSQDKKEFEIGLENYESITFTLQGRFKIYRNTNIPTDLLAIVLDTRPIRKIKSENDKPSSSPLKIVDGKIVSDIVIKRALSYEKIKT